MCVFVCARSHKFMCVRLYIFLLFFFPCFFFFLSKLCLRVWWHLHPSVLARNGKKKVSCFRGHAYGGLAVIHSRGWMAQGSVIQLLIMTDLYPATTLSFSFFFLTFYPLLFALSCCRYVFLSPHWCPLSHSPSLSSLSLALSSRCCIVNIFHGGDAFETTRPK